MSTDTINTPSTDDRIFLNGKQLAEVLDVSAPSLTEAVKKGYNCAGYPVGEWAVETDSGRVKGYDVPAFLISNDNVIETRPNPIKEAPNSPLINPNKGKKISEEASHITNNNYSLLPDGEDYVRPVGMIALPAVLKKALEEDTPQSRVVIAGLITMLGAITGHAVTDNSTGAGIGAGAALGITILMYKYLNPNENHSNQIRNGTNSLIENQFKTPIFNTKQSVFMPN